MNIETGSDLKEWRTINRISQKTLAEHIGYTRNRIAHVESKNEDLSDKLKQAVLKYDALLNPPVFKNEISTRWDVIEEHSNFCYQVFEKTEQALLEMITFDFNK